jgi:hypothetical protein
MADNIKSVRIPRQVIPLTARFAESWLEDSRMLGPFPTSALLWKGALAIFALVLAKSIVEKVVSLRKALESIK